MACTRLGQQSFEHVGRSIKVKRGKQKSNSVNLRDHSTESRLCSTGLNVLKVLFVIVVWYLEVENDHGKKKCHPCEEEEKPVNHGGSEMPLLFISHRLIVFVDGFTRIVGEFVRYFFQLFIHGIFDFSLHSTVV